MGGAQRYPSAVLTYTVMGIATLHPSYIRLVVILFRIDIQRAAGNAVALAGPLSQINQTAAVAAKWALGKGLGPEDDFFAAGAVELQGGWAIGVG